MGVIDTADDVHLDAADAVAEKVLRSPQGGSGVYFAPTASGQPLALAGFGLALGMLSLINVEWVPPAAVGFMVAVAFSIGAIALLIGGSFDLRANNLFGGTWAVAYGCFWISAGLFLLFVGARMGAVAGPGAVGDAFGAYLILWGLLTAWLTVAAWFVARPAFLAFAVVTVVFVTLGISNTAAPGSLSDAMRHVGGYGGLIGAALAWYVAAAITINVTAGRQLLPLWPYVAR